MRASPEGGQASSRFKLRHYPAINEVDWALFRGYHPRLPELVGRHLGLDPRGMKDLRAAVEILDLPVPSQAISLQDCVDLAVLGINATIECQAFWAAPRECGGPIDVAVITRAAEIRFLRRKALRADRHAR